MKNAVSPSVDEESVLHLKEKLTMSVLLGHVLYSSDCKLLSVNIRKDSDVLIYTFM